MYKLPFKHYYLNVQRSLQIQYTKGVMGVYIVCNRYNSYITI